MENALIVELERTARSINTNSNWLLFNSSHQLVVILLSNSSLAYNRDSSLCFIGTTNSSLCTISTCVRIVSLEFDRICHSIHECFLWLTTFATIIVTLFWAIYKLLFWELYQVSSFNKVSTFHWSSWCECPAWSTVTLVLNWGNSTLITPVYISW